MKTTNFSNIYGGTFETLGYSIDVYVRGKYVGNITLDKPDREVSGYHGRKIETLTEPLTLKHRNGTPINLTLPIGTTIRTEMFPINGRIKKK